MGRGGLVAWPSLLLRGRCSCQLAQGPWGPGGFPQGEPRSPTPREVAQCPPPGSDLCGRPPTRQCRGGGLSHSVDGENSRVLPGLAQGPVGRRCVPHTAPHSLLFSRREAHSGPWGEGPRPLTGQEPGRPAGHVAEVRPCDSPAWGGRGLLAPLCCPSGLVRGTHPSPCEEARAPRGVTCGSS